MITKINYHKISRPKPPGKQFKSIEDVPTDLLLNWSTKLFALMNLTWTYVDTIRDLCITMRKGGVTKKLNRELREVKLEYDRFRGGVICRTLEADETQRGEDIEQFVDAQLQGLYYGLTTEINKLGVGKDDTMYLLAVFQALTLMEAVRKYARWCDKEIAKFGVWTCDCCMVQTEFMKLFTLIPQYAKEYHIAPQMRDSVSTAILNKLIDYDPESYSYTD